jgi:putative DNA primase/helicase
MEFDGIEALARAQDEGAPGSDPSWPPREPLPALSAPVPTLSDDLLPTPLRAWLLDAADRINCPVEYVAVPALIAAGSVVGRSVGLRPKRHDDWTIVPNLWGGVIGRPGWLKSPAVAEGARPLYRLVAQAQERYRAEGSTRMRERLELEAREHASKKLLEQAARAKTVNDEEMQRQSSTLAELTEALAACVANERRYVTQDATVEKLAEVLIENPRGLLLLRDELAGWLRALEKIGREGDREFFLEAWNGTSSYTVDRVGRGTRHVPALTLSICGGIQPAKLLPYVAATLKSGRGDDGLLQRFQLLVWPDAIGEWRNVDRGPDREARARACGVYESLDALDPRVIGATVDDADVIPTMHFADDAQELFDDWRAMLEHRLRSAELAALPALDSQLSKYRSLMPSLALLFHLMDAVTTTEAPAAVSLTAARLAAAWCDYLAAHAAKVLAGALHSDVAAALALGAKIVAGALGDGMTVRDVVRREWAGLKTREGAVLAGLDVLERCHWVRRRVLVTGGRPSEVIRVHPDLRRARP